MVSHIHTNVRNASRFELLEELDHQSSLVVLSPELVRSANVNRQSVRQRDRECDLKIVLGKMAVVVAEVRQHQKSLVDILDGQTQEAVGTCSKRAQAVTHGAV